jgi:hypothetical protein
MKTAFPDLLRKFLAGRTVSKTIVSLHLQGLRRWIQFLDEELTG